MMMELCKYVCMQSGSFSRMFNFEDFIMLLVDVNPCDGEIELFWDN